MREWRITFDFLFRQGMHAVETHLLLLPAVLVSAVSDSSLTVDGESPRTTTLGTRGLPRPIPSDFIVLNVD